MAKESKKKKPTKKTVIAKRRFNRKSLKILVFSVIVLLAILISAVGYVFAVSPSAIRNPKADHYHFRMQLVVDGKSVNFAEKKFQEEYDKGQCSGILSPQPIHFHDNKDQFVHVHWDNITGGLVLKNYGWNLIGGPDNKLGYKVNSPVNLDGVPIHSKNLPALPKDAKFWVYTGNSSGYKGRSFNDFKVKDLEEFFGKYSSFPENNKTTFLDMLFPKTYAHEGEDHSIEQKTGDPNMRIPAAPAVSEEERLAKINELIGNVVIFVQPNKPTDQQVKTKFNNLVPLSESTCAG